jgi:hypothetical protein
LRRVRVAYLEGDTASPKYVRSALQTAGCEVRLITPGVAVHEIDEDCIILSDFDAASLRGTLERAVLQALDRGAGLLTVGGWKSYARGGWGDTRLGDRMAVDCASAADDRRAFTRGAYPRVVQDHGIVRELPFFSPFVITGVNVVTPRPDAEVIVEAHEVQHVVGAAASLDEDSFPLLVVRESEEHRYRTVAIATDLSPHWSGSWTDWGGDPLPGEQGEELGKAYVQTIANVVAWLTREATPSPAVANRPADVTARPARTPS